ncbi:unnamed protein product [Cylicostephanus goldi]|uniref:Uncharacterized protein n=1 Tax=Cylicostephanus goldi TaxID=71465 RepID=A0A3P7QTC7_CYLGO|nr:unnamed protein product [Cylicostephanus goldi]
MDESTLTLTPCGEFALVIGESLPLLFFSVLNMMLVQGGFPRFERNSVVSWLFILKIIISVLTVVAMTVSLPLALLMRFHLKPVLLIEYGILAFVWTIYAGLWTYSKIAMSWTRTRGLTISIFLASKMFYIITLNRWLLYGVKDPRTYIPLTVSIAQTIGSIGNLIEWRKHK